ncbi:TPA: ash family protein [Enterobacter hormaechei]|nr:ash family protein [Enterobacter hormaechei]MBK4256951.1 ash family protein [Enterobacter hormaechei]HBN5482341.1 ash family protein [Enterobacter hormaechei]
MPVPDCTHFMVAQVGPTYVGPVSSCTGSSNPAWATTP